MKTLAFACMLLGLASLAMMLMAITITQDKQALQLLPQSLGSAFISTMMYAILSNDKGDPDVKA